MKKGFFVVIDGGDGSGKGTQSNLLLKRLKDENHKASLVDFPRYGKPSAFFVEKYLNGGYGSANEVNSKLSSLFYALDRFDASFDMKKKLEQGYILISNRYTPSSMAHQGGKIDDKEKRTEFIKWIEDLEFNITNIPKPDLVIYLHVPISISQKLIEKKEERNYIKDDDKDIHEKDKDHLTNAQKTYLELIDLYDNFIRLDCTKNNKMMSIEDINQMIYNLLKDRTDNFNN